MKKVISIILLLTMCIGCFAGCAEEKKEDTALNAAKEYLYTMYKDAEEKTAVDYTVVSQVRIDDVTYPITWTTDVAEDKVKITAGENNMTVVDINEATLEQIDYTLTATLKNADGAEVSVSFKHFIPKADGLPATLADGTYVILAGNLTMSSLAADKGYGYPTATEVTVADGAVSGHVAADVLTIKNVDGGFTIQDAQGRYFYLKGTYNSFNVDATAPAEGHVFSILAKDGKYLIQNNLDKKTLAYSSSYTSWGCYPELTDDHISLVDIVAATAPAETPNNGNTENTGNSGNSGNTGNTNNDPAADSTLTVEQVIALGASKAHDTYTAGKYYVTGVITEVYNTTYGNMKITDDKGNILTIYGTYDATGANRYDAMATKPAAGDTVTIYGIVGQYNDTPQIKNGWITAHIPTNSGSSGNSSGNTSAPAPTPSAGWTKVSSLNEGDKIVIVNPASNMALSMTKTGYYNNGVDVSSNFNSITNEEIFTVKKNSDGSVTLTSVSGKKVALADSFSSLNEEGTNDKWTISDAGDGNAYLLNVGRELYLEWYASKNNWSAYNPGADKLNADYVLAFYKQA